MSHSLLSTYDTHHPVPSDLLVNSVKSYINSKLDNERKTAEFITEVRRRLYLIHEYNDQVAKLTHTYPRSTKFDLLLVKYVELEFEALYYNNPNPPRQAEVLTELRVLRLLQVMLYPTVLNNESLINENTDAILKKTVLRLLGGVKASCLIENKLVHNIATKLLKKVNGRNYEFNISALDTHEIHKNLATSDYGTDDNDSDFEIEVHNKGTVHKEKVTFEHKSDCVEVPLTVNGVAPIPTIEFADDGDDDNYMVYLQQQKTRCKVSYKDSVPISNNLCNTQNSHDKFVGNHNNKICDNESNSAQNEKSHNTALNSGDNCVVLSSDEEGSNVQTQKKTKKIYRHKQEKRKDKNIGVVTFELIDDDDNDQPTYMMYLQKEVETKKKKYLKTKNLEPEVIICSDSEDEVVEISEKSNDIELPSLDVGSNSEDTNNETNVQEDSTQQREKESSKNNNCDSMFDEDTLDDILDLVDTRPFQDVEGSHFEDNEIVDEESCNVNSIASTPVEIIPAVLHSLNNIDNINKETDSRNTSISSQDSIHLLMLENKIGMDFCEESPTNFLIDPAVVFEEMSYPSAQSNTDTLASNQCDGVCQNQEMEVLTSDACFEVLNTDKPDAPGGPVLSEKMEDSDVDSLQEHSLNTSILDLFLDDNYLLEGRKQFEELECFLFDDNNKGGLGYYDRTNPFLEGNESSVSKNAKSLESLLNESQVFLEDKEVCSHEMTSKPSHSFLKKRKRVLRRKHKIKKNNEKIKSDASKNFTNSRAFQDVLKNVSLTDFLHQTECNFKASCRRKSDKTCLR